MTLPMLRLHTSPEPAAPAVPEPPADVPGAATSPAAPGSAVTSGDRKRVTMRHQVAAAVTHAFRTARRRASDLAGREGGWLNALLAGHAPSVNDQRDYLANRRWVPPGHEDGIADRAGEAYQAGIGIPGVALGNWISATASRPFRATWTLVVLLAAVFAACRLAGLGTRTGLAAGGAVAGSLAGWLLLVAGVLGLRRSLTRRRHP